MANKSNDGARATGGKGKGAKPVCGSSAAKKLGVSHITAKAGGKG